MLAPLSALLTVGLVAVWVLGLASWVATVVYGFKAIRRSRPGVSLWTRATLWNPTNTLLRPELLTEEGRRYRGRCLCAAPLFVGCVACVLVAGAVTGNLK
jgi:hypothetical protein